MKCLSRILAVVGIAASLSCGGSKPAPPAAATLYRHLEGDPNTLDPITSAEESGVLVDELIFRPLVGMDAQRRPVPSLAASWNVTPDGLTYEFHLDPKFTWETGQPVTSDDVRFTIERVHDPKAVSPTWHVLYEDLVAVETPDPATVRVRFSRPYAERMYAFSLPIVSAAAFAGAKDAAEVGRRPVGSGPYRLESWESNAKLRLVRRDGPANADAHYGAIVFRVIPDAAVKYQAGLRGELDEFRLGRDQVVSARASGDFTARYRIVKVPILRVSMLVWNVHSPFLSDPRVRIALAHAWPRAETARSLYPPDGAYLLSGPYPAGVPENDPALAPTTYDPAESARLLDAAGWKLGPGGFRHKGGKKASIEMLHPSGKAIYTSIGEILRSAYEKVGVELVMRPIEWAAFSARYQKGEFEVAFSGLIFLPPNVDPYPYYHSSQWPPGGENTGFYKSAEADKVIEAARSESDPARRLELYRQVARIFAADPPADFLFGADQYWAFSKRVENVEISPFYGIFHFLQGPLGWRPAPAGKR
jgi:peptide/nickel transport system substrate-binding protein